MMITRRHALQGAAAVATLVSGCKTMDVGRDSMAIAIIIKEGRRAIDGRPDIRLLRRDRQTAIFEVASGQHRFTTE